MNWIKVPNSQFIRILEKCLDRVSNQGSIGYRGYLKLPQADWKGNAEGAHETEIFLKILIWDDGYTQVVESPTQGDALMDVYPVRPEVSLIACNFVPGISDHCAVLLEIDWVIPGPETQIGRLVPVYNKTDISGLKTFPREKFSKWVGNGTSVEEIWNNYKGIVFEGIKQFVPHKTLRSNPYPEYYNREVKRLKRKVREAYKKRKSGEPYQIELQRLSKQLLAAKKNAQETFLRTVLQNEGKCWTKFLSM
jgi:hypothetical protein